MTLRLAHRGDWRAAPENTIGAFAAALRIQGCDGVELDVRATADGVPVVLHDKTLQRVQGVGASVSQISALEAGAHGIPTLAEVFAAIWRGAFVDVELKEWVPAVVDVLESARGPGLEQVAVSAFDVGALDEVGRARPSWPRWLNTVNLDSTAIARALELGCTGIAAQWRFINERTAAAATAAGLNLVGWTVRRRATYRRLERLGAYAICAEGLALDG